MNQADPTGVTPLAQAIMNDHAKVAQIFYHRDYLAMQEFRICILSARRTPVHALHLMSVNGHDPVLLIESFLLPDGSVIRNVARFDYRGSAQTDSATDSRRKRIRRML